VLTARRVIPPLALAAVVVLVVAAWAVRGPGEKPVAIAGGSASRGETAMAQLGCGTCHTIPGVTGADAGVGPPLTRWAERRYIAGRIENSPGNLVRWIMSPQAVEPGTAMPDLGVSEETARDIAAYLYTLGDRDRVDR